MAPPEAKKTEVKGVKVDGDFHKTSSGNSRAAYQSSGPPKGTKKEYVIAHGHLKHPSKWGPYSGDIKSLQGRTVVQEFVDLHEGDKVFLTDEERERMDPKGVKFVSETQYERQKVLDEARADERRKQLKQIANDEPNAPVPDAPADRLLGNQRDGDSARVVARDGVKI